MIRKPEMTKNTSTPMNPPIGFPVTCSSTTRPTATARSPWMSSRFVVAELLEDTMARRY